MYPTSRNCTYQFKSKNALSALPSSEQGWASRAIITTQFSQRLTPMSAPDWGLGADPGITRLPSAQEPVRQPPHWNSLALPETGLIRIHKAEILIDQSPNFPSVYIHFGGSSLHQLLFIAALA
jgi:hypothetical protein